MIDTVTIKVADKDFVLFDPDQHFANSKYQELKGKFGVFGKFWTRYTDYPKKQKKLGKYFPQVSIIYQSRRRRGGGSDDDRWLLIQVSVPKLLYGTNLFDITNQLIPVFAQKLTERLEEVNIKTEPKLIMGSIVQRIDYSKILKISPSYGKTSQMIDELSKYDLKQSSDFNKNNYHTGKDGRYLKFYNSSQSLVIYDKFDEITINRTTNLEQEIARQYKTGKWKRGALRIEASLQRKQTVEAIIRRHGTFTKKKGFTLAEAAQSDISKSFLLETFKKVYMDGYSGLVRLEGLKDNELEALIENATDNYRDRSLIYYLTHRTRTIGLKPAVTELQASCSPSTAGRHKRTVSGVLEAITTKKDTVDVIGYLYRKLARFSPVLPKQLSNWNKPK